MNNSSSGMTLVELLIALAISGLLLGGVLELFHTHNLMAAKQEETSLMEQELMTAMVQMTDDLRRCGFAPNGGSFGFADIDDKGRRTNATAIYFTLDEDKDGSLDDNGTEQIGYRINVNADGSTRDTANNVLSKYSKGKWQTMASNIGGLVFAYQDADGTIITDPASHLNDIRTVAVTCTGVPSTARAGLSISSRVMTSTILCRNLND